MLSCKFLFLFLQLIRLHDILTFTPPSTISHKKLSKSNRHINHGNQKGNNCWEPLEKSIQELSISNSILDKIQAMGFQDSHQVSNFANDFKDRPEVLSQILQQDFDFQVLESHYARAAILHMLNSSSGPFSKQTKKDESKGEEHECGTNNDNPTIQMFDHKNSTVSKPFKSFIIDDKAKKRRNDLSGSSSSYEYGLSSNSIQEYYPTLHMELEDFYTFMTTSVPSNPGKIFEQKVSNKRST